MIWTPEEDKKLIALYESEYTMAQIADMFEQKCTAGSISARISSLGIGNRIIKSKREGYKYCYGCQEELPLDEFYPRKRSDPDGPRYSRCKDCAKHSKKINNKKK